MNTRKLCIISFTLFLAITILPQLAQANDLKVSNVRLGPRDTNAKTLSVLFDLTWQNSWRNKINHDAAWLTVRLEDTAAGKEKTLCTLSSSGLNPSGVARGSNADMEIVVPGDKTGAFFRRSTNHATSDLTTTGAMLTVNYGACGFNENSQVLATVVAFEMVYVPQGAFYAGDHATSAAAFQRGGADNAPWPIISEAAINVTATSGNGYYYVSAGNPGETPSGSSFVIPASFPKGFNSFYMMKYEITEGQWVDFVNSLSPQARLRRDITDTAHKNSDAVISRNTIACSGSPLVCSTDRPFRAMTFLTWQDLAAFLDWSALRPMTELEYEKSARGPFLPVNGEYAWGSSKIVAATTITGIIEDGSELVSTPRANARYNGVALTGGDALNGAEYQQGPLRVGIFSTDSSDRFASGAGNYGAMDLSGNVKEWTVTVGNPSGLTYMAVHGDGILTSAAGYEGNANTLGWPGMSVDQLKGVVSSAGNGFRGGSWSSIAARLGVSDRMEAAATASDAASTYGGRGVRSAEGL
ncbi:MAG: SUMF1/EgtB/PvdO family nonheme iron enzyme [Candidatus Omnitrophica bacterium]|nr:SUMF1/EgtB/PvdO family nonheme iron enzyme [Candidatus Omnitrophota bacterium]